MIHTIRVQTIKGPDLPGDGLFYDVKANLNIRGLRKIQTAKVYRLEGVNENDAKKLAMKAFCEIINQTYSLNEPIFKHADQTLEIAYKPGVMNPEVASILKCATDLGISITAADVGREYGFYGAIKQKDVEIIAKQLHLLNPLIEYVLTKNPQTLQIKGAPGKTSIVSIRAATDQKLLELSKDKLFLNLEEMKVIQSYFQKIKRDPTDCELEILAQTWSEHCGHKTFKAKLTIDGRNKEPFIDRIKKTAQGHKSSIVSAFVDNSGVIDFYDGYGICGKVETHNSPSAIEPYGGAMTGSGGVFRDVLGTGQGAKVLISTDIFCFAPPSLPKKDVPPGCLPPDYLLTRVVAGVRDYGNRVGIPTNNGSIHFHKDFRAKPTVAVGAYGIIEKKKAKKRSPQVKDLIVILGGRTGRDGIHGATFSSSEMTHQTKTALGTAVQIGNAIEEKRVIDAIMTLSDKKLIRAITDCGAGGFSSAIGEMGKDTGAVVQLADVPLKYLDLTPWEIFLSESQERMILAIDPKNKKRVLEICDLYNVEASIIGFFDNSKKLRVYYKKENVCDLSMQFLHDGLPQRHMVGKTKPIIIKEALPKESKNYEDIWLSVMSNGNVCSKEPIVRLYDHTVQGRTTLHPFGGISFDAPNNGSIVQPFFGKPYGLATAHGLNPGLNQFDSYWGSIWAITEAVSNYVSMGGNIKDAALIDNFIWPFPDESSLADLDKAVDACTNMAKLLDIPFVSGKDSLSSTYRYPSGDVLKIPPVLLVSVFGKIPDVRKTATSDFKKKDSIIVLLGEPDAEGLGGSTYFSITNAQSAKIPHVALSSLPKILNAITTNIQNKSFLSCHDISEGGIAGALTEMCFGGGCGATINLAKISKSRADFTFFNETAGTFLAEVEDEETAKKTCKGIPYAILGKTQKNPSITIHFDKKTLAHLPISRLKNAWQKPMKEYFS